MFIGDWMRRGAQYWPDNLAVVDVAKGEAGRFTYAALNRRADAVAGWLRGRGVERGDRVALLAHSGVEVLDVFFACAKLGAIFVPLNWRSPWRELVDVILPVAPKVLVFGPEFAATAAELHPHTAIAELVHLEGEPLAGSTAYATILAGPADPVDNPAVDVEDIACLLFTGGTTGAPKAARISYRQIAWNTLNTMVHEIQRGDVTITHTPMFHTGGLFVYTVPLLTLGGTVVIMKKWTADDMLALIEQYEVTALFCVPTQYQMMLDSPRFAATSFASVRFLTSGGAPLPVPLIRAFCAVHKVAFKQGFGMTEFGPGAFSLAPEFGEAKAGSIGRPNYFVDARIVDEDNVPVKDGEVGELVLKGPAACSGYFGVDAPHFDEHGFFHTGDLARRDAEGFYYIVDRKKDMFISGGENVYPVEIEKILYEHPAVAQCAVISVPDAQWGEVGKAVVALRPGASASEAELLQRCRDHLARYKVPKSVVFLDALPLSPAGKILKRELRTLLSSSA
ncbi:AMP-binding protein [Nannocystis pusilla]|uniref:AMP-binding protein n=1 Tax=Nannocystis pusilla TaxID=889268 RepID=UPI003BF3E970